MEDDIRAAIERADKAQLLLDKAQRIEELAITMTMINVIVFLVQIVPRLNL